MIKELTGNPYDEPYKKIAFYDFNGRFVGLDGEGLNSKKVLFHLVSISKVDDKWFTAMAMVPNPNGKEKGSGTGYMTGAKTDIEAFNKALDGIQDKI